MCDGNDKCSWCHSDDVPSICHSVVNAKKLNKTGVFKCDKVEKKEDYLKTFERRPHILWDDEKICYAMKNDSSCESNLKCSWCSSNDVPSACHSKTMAKKLPAGVFKCSNVSDEHDSHFRHFMDILKGKNHHRRHHRGEEDKEHMMGRHHWKHGHGKHHRD